MTRTQLKVVYDGACPFCSSYVRLVRLRQNYAVDLVDARSDQRVREHYERRGFNLDAGMIVEADDKIYYGADAVWFLAAVSSRSGFWNRTIATAFRSRIASRLLYPLMKLGRRITLRVLRKPPLNPTA